MTDVILWQGFLTQVYIDTEREPGKTLLVSSTTVGNPHPDPDAAWKDAEEFKEKFQRHLGAFVESGICPAGHHKEQVGEPAIKKVLN